MAAAKEIREARLLLERAGLLKNVVPADLVAAAKELNKPLRDALQVMMDAFADAEGG